MFVLLTNTEEEYGGGKNGVDLLLQGVLAVFVTEILICLHLLNLHAWLDD